MKEELKYMVERMSQSIAREQQRIADERKGVEASRESHGVTPSRVASKDELQLLRAELQRRTGSLESAFRVEIELLKTSVAALVDRVAEQHRRTRQRTDEIELKVRHVEDSMTDMSLVRLDPLRREVTNLARQLTRLQSRITVLEESRRD